MLFSDTERLTADGADVTDEEGMISRSQKFESSPLSAVTLRMTGCLGLGLPLIDKVSVKMILEVYGIRANRLDKPPGEDLRAECAKNAEKKMASTNYMKFAFSEPASDPGPSIAVVSDLP